MQHEPLHRPLCFFCLGRLGSLPQFGGAANKVLACSRVERGKPFSEFNFLFCIQKMLVSQRRDNAVVRRGNKPRKTAKPPERAGDSKGWIQKRIRPKEGCSSWRRL